MRKTFAIAALLAATAFTPALAQEEPREARSAEGATAQEPTPIPQRVEAQMAQRERGERGPRAEGSDAPRPQWGGGQGGGGERGGGQRGAEGGWQRPQTSAPVYQTPVYQAPVQQAPAPTAPVQREWNRADSGGQSWQGGQRPDWSARNANPQGGQPGWTRPTPPVATAPVSPQPQGNWQNREQRRDTWQRNGQGNRQENGVGGFPQRDNRSWNGDNGWNGQNRNDPRRNDTWQNGRDGRNDTWQNGRDGRNDTWRNQGQWNRDGRQDTWRNNGRNDGRSDGWRNDGRRNDTWRNDGWRGNNRYDQRSQWQNQYRDWNRNWSRDWRRDQRYDWQRYRSYNRDLFYGDRYYAPYGWNYGYRRFSIGFSLSYLLYDQQYWIDDPYSYRLPPAYGPYRWVRYYDDVLLVDLRTGQVVDAIYDFFW